MRFKNPFVTHPVFTRLSIVFVLPIIISIVYGWAYLKSSLPVEVGVIDVAHLERQVEITRDRWAVPHIRANKDYDAFFAIGYMHAQDRLWQLEMQRRTGAGRLSEILGRETLLLDQFMRTLGIYKSAEDSWNALSSEAKGTLDAYVNGVNAWIEKENPLPVEYKILGFKPERWTTTDSLATLNLLALNLCGNWREEINRLLLLQQLDEPQAEEVFPGYPEGGTSTVNDELKSDLSSLKSLKGLLDRVESDLKLNAYGVGSNAWVVSGEHTESGKPILAGDPHLVAQIPSSFYVAEIQGDRIHASGATLPGLPFVVVGNNRHIAWSSTNMMADTQDLYKERLSLENPDLYEFNGEMVEMEIRNEKIIVKPDFPAALRDPIVPLTWKVRSTKRGPVISDVTSHVDQAISLQWTALSKNNTTYESFMKWSYAQDWDSLNEAFRDFVSPALNVVYADKKGNIGYAAVGKIPTRKNGNGSHPVPGWNSLHEWTGYIPFDEMPRSYNPKTGYLINANNRVIGEHYPYHITVDWVPPFRADRIEELLVKSIQSGEKITSKYIASIQKDQKSSIAETLAPLFERVQGLTKKQQEAIGYIRGWNYVTSIDSIESTIFHSWLRNLQYMMLRDDYRGSLLNEARFYYLYNSLEQLSPFFIERVLSENRTEWCDQVHTPAIESCEELLILALDKSIKELEKLLGHNMESWIWGEAHRISYNHSPFSNSNMLKHTVEFRMEEESRRLI